MSQQLLLRAATCLLEYHA